MYEFRVYFVNVTVLGDKVKFIEEERIEKSVKD